MDALNQGRHPDSKTSIFDITGKTDTGILVHYRNQVQRLRGDTARNTYRMTEAHNAQIQKGDENWEAGFQGIRRALL